MARKSGSSSQKTRPLVHAAALSLFARHGYAAVSMRQIASEVGVQAGALYRYTPDKQSLLFELMRVHMEELLARVRALIRRASGLASAEIVCGPVLLDTRSGRVSVAGRPLTLTSHEYRVLAYLMHRKGEVVSVVFLEIKVILHFQLNTNNAKLYSSVIVGSLLLPM